MLETDVYVLKNVCVKIKKLSCYKRENHIKMLSFIIFSGIIFSEIKDIL